MNDSYRSLFPVTKHFNYMNHAAVAAAPTPTIEAIQSQLADVNQNGFLNYRHWLAVKENARRLLSVMLGARPEQVAFVRNTSDGLSTVANGLQWQTGDNLVTFQHEFPSNLYPWLHLRDVRGVEVRLCPEREGRIDLDEFISMIDSRTRLVAISQVQFASGFRVDLERIGRAARKHDALLVVDVIQGLGVLPTNVEAELIDVAAGGGHKWLITPEGVGYLYLSDQARARIEPTLIGWTSVRNPDDYGNYGQGLNDATLPWETGTNPISLIHGLEASLKLLNDVGVERIQKHLENLTDQLCDGLGGRKYKIVSSRLPGEKSQIVCIQHTAGLSAMDLYVHLKRLNIITAPRNNTLRISPHFFNTSTEIAELLEALPD